MPNVKQTFVAHMNIYPSALLVQFEEKAIDYHREVQYLDYF